MTDDRAELTSAQYATLLDAVEDVVFVLDRDLSYTGIWGGWMAKHDIAAAAFRGKKPWDVFGESSREVFEPLCRRVLDGKAVTTGQWLETSWGEKVYYHTTLAPLRDDDDGVIGIVGIARDITESMGAKERLEHLATHDPLTDLPNRAAFQNAVERATARAGRGVDVALLFLDLDNFKACNDVYGHETGDEVLAMIAQTLRDHVREPDIVARIGGDEFGIVLDDADIETARVKAEELREVIHGFGQRFELDLDLSVGITAIKGDSSFVKVLQAADRAMYEAKGMADEQVVIAG